jgi:hypothetical protein
MSTTTTADGVLGDIASGVQRGADDARSAAEQTLPLLRYALGMGTYWASYGLSFGVIYTGELAMQVVPEESSMRRGFADGARDAHARRAARKVAQDTDDVEI